MILWFAMINLDVFKFVHGGTSSEFEWDAGVVGAVLGKVGKIDLATLAILCQVMIQWLWWFFRQRYPPEQCFTREFFMGAEMFMILCESRPS